MQNIELLQKNNDRFLWIDGRLWMWDTQQERELQEELSNQSFGDVLVAGYGFGILNEYLLNNPKVTSVTTIEERSEIIDEMNNIDGQIYGRVIIGDFYKTPEDKKYDCVIGDIWPDITAKFLADYVSFKDKAQRLLKPNGIILAWGKDYFEYLLLQK